jgi:hypothetical protein
MLTKRRRKWRYPRNWKQFADACKNHAGWKCVECQEAHLTTKISKRTGQVYTMYLHAAHVGRYTKRPRLKALCPSCHARMDWQRRQRNSRVKLERVKHVRLLLDRPITTAYAYL